MVEPGRILVGFPQFGECFQYRRLDVDSGLYQTSLRRIRSSSVRRRRLFCGVRFRLRISIFYSAGGRSALLGLDAGSLGVQRITLFDTWLASVFVGRTVATIAEVAFVAQWALILNFIARETGSRSAALIGAWIVPIILVAETCSWYAVVTTSYIGNVIEESLWATTYSLIAVALVSLFLRFKDVAKYAIGVAIVGCAIYVGFMATVDVPMYFNRWQQDVVAAKESLGLWSGLVDLNTRWLVTHEISEWKEEIPWMSLYFSVAVWVSLLLCYVPMTKEHLRHHLKI